MKVQWEGPSDGYLNIALYTTERNTLTDARHTEFAKLFIATLLGRNTIETRHMIPSSLLSMAIYRFLHWNGMKQDKLQELIVNYYYFNYMCKNCSFSYCPEEKRKKNAAHTHTHTHTLVTLGAKAFTPRIRNWPSTDAMTVSLMVYAPLSCKTMCLTNLFFRLCSWKRESPTATFGTDTAVLWTLQRECWQ
jgi:hypothetical protein